MATGDTIPGKIDVQRVDTAGNAVRVAGPFDSEDVDPQASLTPDEYLYLNTPRSDRVDAPLQAREEVYPDARFLENETVRVRFQADATVTNDIDHDHADVAKISILRRTNRGIIDPDRLTVQDQDLTSDVTESASDYVSFFEYTVPPGEQVRLVGRFLAAAIEN